jgi:hypothetical protein
MTTSTARLLVILTALLGTSVALAAEKTYDKRLDAPPGGHLTFNADVGSVTVVGRDAPQVIIHADLQGSQAFLDRLHMRAEQTPTGVTFSARVDHNGWTDWFHLGNTRVRFTVEVPRDYPIDLRTAGGGLDLRNLNASVHAATSGGGILLQDIAGAVNVHTSGGGIKASGLKAGAQLDSSGGGIEVRDSSGDLNVHTSGGPIAMDNDDGKVDAGTSGGSIRAQLRSNHGISLRSSGGSITLLLPQGAHGSIDAATSGGRVTSDFPLSSTQTTDHSHLVGAIGGGGPAIYLHTSGGSIRIVPGG